MTPHVAWHKLVGTSSFLSISRSQRSIEIQIKDCGPNTLPRRYRAVERKNLKIEELVALVDTREQRPFDLAPLMSKRATLGTGDYSVEGFQEKIAIERKSLQDFIGCCGRERSRFEREVSRLRGFAYRAIVIEGHWAQLDLKQYRGTLHPNAVIGSALGWALDNVSIVMAGDAQRAGKLVARMLWIAANRIHRGENGSAIDCSA